MTLTTGLAPVAPSADAAAGTVREALLRLETSRPALGWLVLGFDVLAAAVAVVVGVSLASAPGTPLTALVVVAWPLAVTVAGGYSRLSEDPYAVRPRALLTAGAVLALLAWCALLLVPGVASALDPRTLAASFLVVAGSAPAASIAFRSLLPLVVPRRPVRVVVVGHAGEARALLREAVRASGRPPFEPVAVCLPGVAGEDDFDPAVEAWPVPMWQLAEGALLDVVRSHRAEAVVVAPGPGIGHAELRRWGAWLQHLGVDLLVSPGLRDVAPDRLGLATMGGSRLVRVRHAALTGPGQRVKGVVERAVAALLLLLLAPVLGALVLLVRRDSPGPALFRQTRVGRHGRPFTVFKLRTMCFDADRLVEELAQDNESDRDGVLFKIKRDPRVTRLGARLRPTRWTSCPNCSTSCEARCH